jgi:hypothetical protein
MMNVGCNATMGLVDSGILEGYHGIVNSKVGGLTGHPMSVIGNQPTNMGYMQDIGNQGSYHQQLQPLPLSIPLLLQVPRTVQQQQQQQQQQQ